MIKSNYRLGKYEKHECWVFFKNRMRPFSHSMLIALSFQTRLKRYPFSRHWGGRPSEPALQQGISMFANYSSHQSPIKTPHFFLAAASLSLPRIPFAKQKLTCACNRMNNAKSIAIVCIAFRKISLFPSRCFKITEYTLSGKQWLWVPYQEFPLKPFSTSDIKLKIWWYLHFSYWQAIGRIDKSRAKYIGIHFEPSCV